MALILLIEDNEELRTTIMKGLVNVGHDVTTASGGIKGLEIINSKKIDVVVTDIVMSAGEGVETLRWIKEIKPNLPVIAMSGFPQYLDFIKRLGATDTLKKPFKIKDLLKIIKRTTKTKTT